VDLRLFDGVGPGSLVFFDGSHYCLMGSDATVFFMEVLPRLRPGVLVHVHDIFLPHDYPPAWAKRYYSEQYLLAAWLLGGGSGFRIEFPVHFVLHDTPLMNLAEPIFRTLPAQVRRHGGSFWMRRI
jgi:hypothetical protein